MNDLFLPDQDGGEEVELAALKAVVQALVKADVLPYIYEEYEVGDPRSDYIGGGLPRPQALQGQRFEEPGMQSHMEIDVG